MRVGETISFRKQVFVQNLKLLRVIMSKVRRLLVKQEYEPERSEVGQAYIVPSAQVVQSHPNNSLPLYRAIYAQ